jgi:uncharacterized membrane protein
MNNELCHLGTSGSLGNMGVLDGIGVILNLVLWVGLLAGLVLLVVWAVRRARVPAVTGPSGSGQTTAKEILQARYARDEISREQYETMKQDLE